MTEGLNEIDFWPTNYNFLSILRFSTKKVTKLQTFHFDVLKKSQNDEFPQNIKISPTKLWSKTCVNFVCWTLGGRRQIHQLYIFFVFWSKTNQWNILYAPEMCEVSVSDRQQLTLMWAGVLVGSRRRVESDTWITNKRVSLWFTVLRNTTSILVKRPLPN